ncbi:hypothetical protein BSKO_04552 [Bryopsis sp. KO-2023]|nr:hypothetical protein BSKO_04552 [Bryopsis sp. KO-2023]
MWSLSGSPLETKWKGANIIPMDIIHSKPTENEIRQMTADAREANMNMLRVWGGGNYFSHAFYDACDELGVLVWQKAMFACGMYPRHEPFLKEVSIDKIEQEVSFQAFRLGSHPSIVIWGSNNENENSMDWFKVTWDNRIRYAVDLYKIFVDTVGAALNKVDPHVLYIDTSPSNGVISEDPYVKRYGNTNCIEYGDVHFYDYVNDGLSYSTFPKAKFVSEFGFQSFPSFEAYRAVSSPEDWSYDSELSEFRQRHPNGNKELLSQLERHFTLPLARDPDENPKRQELLFKHWIYLTQLHQALCYDTAVRYWRSLKSDPKALTRGALYWQLNDIWQGPSWSGINYGGQWKLLHYVARQFFAPFAISTRLHKANQTLEIHVTSDVNSELQVSMEGKVSRFIPIARTINSCGTEFARNLTNFVDPVFNIRQGGKRNEAEQEAPVGVVRHGQGGNLGGSAASPQIGTQGRKAKERGFRQVGLKFVRGAIAGGTKSLGDETRENGKTRFGFLATRRPWSDEETSTLLRGIERSFTGRWNKIYWDYPLFKKGGFNGGYVKMVADGARVGCAILKERHFWDGGINEGCVRALGGTGGW